MENGGTLSVIASGDATSPEGERFWQCGQLALFAKGSPFGRAGEQSEMTERARMLTERVSLPPLDLGAEPGQGSGERFFAGREREGYRTLEGSLYYTRPAACGRAMEKKGT